MNRMCMQMGVQLREPGKVSENHQKTVKQLHKITPANPQGLNILPISSLKRRIWQGKPAVLDYFLIFIKYFFNRDRQEFRPVFINELDLLITLA